PLTLTQRAARNPAVEHVHYILEQAVEQLKDFRQLILVGAQAPVAYFAAPGKNAVLTSPECEIHTCASPDEDCAGALEALAAALSLDGMQLIAAYAERPSLPSGDIHLQGLAAAICALLPEN